MNKHLSYETSRALYNIGVWLKTDASWGILLDEPKKHYIQTKRSWTEEYYNSVQMDIPAPDLVELLDALPKEKVKHYWGGIAWRTRNEQGGHDRHFQEGYVFVFDDKYGRMEHFGVQESPVEACGLLLLKLYNEKVLVLDQPANQPTQP